MFLGQFNPTIIFRIPFYITAVTLVLIYYISLYYGHEPPFPHCWISKVAQHYPEFLFFRFATISGAAMIILGWFTNYFYFKTIAREKVFNIKKYQPEIPLVLGIIGGILLMGNTATIDTGQMNTHWHTSCASKFFIFTLAAQLLNTIFSWLVYLKIKTISKNVLYFKTFIIVLLLVQLYISSVYGYTYPFSEVIIEGSNTVAQFLEWTLTLTVMAGFYAMSFDVQKFEFVYEMRPSSSETSIDQ